MNITVVMCTYNRCHCLSAALESLAVQVMPDSVVWEVVAVDNNSTDETRMVVEDIAEKWPGRFRYVFESRQGLSHARNRGIQESHGELIAFTDDDVMVKPDWLWNLTSRLSDGEWTGAGGRIVPTWEKPLPSWLSAHEIEPFVSFDAGAEPGRLDKPPFGANMAFKKEMFHKYGGFRTDLGRTGGDLIDSEDTEFGRRLLSAGELLWYEPSAVVYHPVVENRIQKSYFLSWWFGHGRADVREWPCGAYIFGIPRRALTFFKFLGIRLPMRIIQWVLTFNPQRRFRRKCWVWKTAGQMVEVRHQWYDAKAETIAREGSPRSDNNRNSVHL